MRRKLPDDAPPLAAQRIAAFAENVVITRQPLAIAGCMVMHSLEEALTRFPADEELFIIGGAQIYAAALPIADRFYLTRVGHAYEGDTRFPAWNPAE